VTYVRVCNGTNRDGDLTGVARWQAIPSNFSRRLGRHLFGGV
jgi:hypothetical protein